MQIRYFDGLTATEKVSDEEEAKEILKAKYPNAYFSEWDENNAGDRIFMLVWESEEESIDDGGDAAVAIIEERI